MINECYKAFDKYRTGSTKDVMSKLFGKDAPCRYCKNRAVGCHSDCEEYIEWSDFIRKAARSESQRVQSDGYLVENMLIRATRMHRGRVKSVRFDNKMGR